MTRKKRKDAKYMSGVLIRGFVRDIRESRG